MYAEEKVIPIFVNPTKIGERKKIILGKWIKMQERDGKILANRGEIGYCNTT